MKYYKLTPTDLVELLEHNPLEDNTDSLKELKVEYYLEVIKDFKPYEEKPS